MRERVHFLPNYLLNPRYRFLMHDWLIYVEIKWTRGKEYVKLNCIYKKTLALLCAIVTLISGQDRINYVTSSNETVHYFRRRMFRTYNWLCLVCLRAPFLTREAIWTTPFYGFSFGCSHPGDVSEKLLVTEVVISASSWSSYELKIEKV